MSRASGTPKTGGRKKGTPNKATAARQAEIAASGLTPLQFHTKKYRYYEAIVDEELAKEKPNHERINFAFMAGGIAARDAAPYVHARLHPIEEQPQQRVIMEWNWTKELLDKLPAIRRGKPFRPYIGEQNGGQPSSIIHEPDVSRDCAKPNLGVEQRGEAKGPSDSISPKKHWSE
jgi:hypothetical protein